MTLRIGSTATSTATAIVLVLLVAFALPGCPSSGSVAPPSVTATSHSLKVVSKDAARPATSVPVAYVEVVSTQAARERGLMGRERLEPDHGMLFVYAKPTPRRFWMKGCTIGLDIAFIRDDGTVSEIATLPPGASLPDDQVAAASSNGPVLYVLEMETGWFEKRGIRVGAVVDVADAVAGVSAE